MKFGLIFVVSLILFSAPVHAQEESAGGFSLNFFCNSAALRQLFNLSCDGVSTSDPDPIQTSPRSLQLRFFVPPIPTATPTIEPDAPTPTIIPQTPTPTRTTSITSAPTSIASPTPPNLAGKTLQVDWAYEGKARCWSAWADFSCSLLSHEGGITDRDLDFDGSADIECSTGDGSTQTTTVTNISSKPIEMTCERYACTLCESGNGTHAQCDGLLDPTATRLSDLYTITPGCTATCTIHGVYGSCLPGSVTSTPPASSPIPTKAVVVLDTPTPISTQPTSEPGSHPTSIRALNLRVQSLYNIPWQVIEAIQHIEGAHIFKLSSADVVRYQQPGARVPTHCTPNACSAMGPMQFTTGVDHRGSTSCSVCGLSRCPATWYSYRSSVLDDVYDGRTPHVCNLKDSVYAAGKMLKNRSRSAAHDRTWTYTEVKNAASAYYGSCTPCHLARPGSGADLACKRLGMTYCDYVWSYYQKNK